MNIVVWLKFLTGILVILGVAGCTNTNAGSPMTPTVIAESAIQSTEAQIYMFRGGFNGVFSTGITEMATELRRRGVPAQDLSWAASNASISKIRQAKARNLKAGPVILAGHSLGASSVIGMARQLTRDDIEVDLLIVFDPLGSSTVPKSVRKLINFKASGNKSNPGGFVPGEGFSGQIVNVDIRNLPGLETSSHWNIVNQPELQKKVIQEIVSVYRKYN